MTDKLAKAIKQARLQRNLSQSALAKLLSITRGAVNQWETGETAPSRKRLEKLSQILEIAPLSLVQGEVSATHAAPGVLFRPSRTGTEAMERSVPVVFTRARQEQDALSPGDFYASDVAVDQVRGTARLAGRADVRALYVHGDAMVPRFRDGELIYIETARPPTRGDYVVVILKNTTDKSDSAVRPAMIRLLLGLTTTVCRLEQHAPKRIEQFTRNRIHLIARVMTLSDMLGV